MWLMPSNDKEGAAARGERSPTGMVGALKVEELPSRVRRSGRCSRKWMNSQEPPPVASIRHPPPLYGDSPTKTMSGVTH
jgi:hypothetical protein